MKKSKYMMSGGLAFVEESDMNKLRKQSLQGWHVKEFSSFGYRLEKGEPEDMVYTIDYHLVDEADLAEYLGMFEIAGWKHVCSEYNMHIFKAVKGTKPIYTDSGTKKEKYSRLATSWGWASIVLLGLLLISLFLRLNMTGITQTVGSIGIAVTAILFVPTCMTYIAILQRKSKNYHKTLGWASIVLLGLLPISLLLRLSTTGIMQTISSMGFVVILILFVPSCMTYITLYRGKSK